MSDIVKHPGHGIGPMKRGGIRQPTILPEGVKVFRVEAGASNREELAKLRVIERIEAARAAGIPHDGSGQPPRTAARDIKEVGRLKMPRHNIARGQR